jgi:hypothetical protein
MSETRNDQIRIQREGLLIRVTQRRPRGPEVHIAEFPHIEPLACDGPRGTPIILPRPQHPDVVEELRLLLIEQPVSRYDPGHEYLACDGHDGLRIPWAVERRTGLALPAQQLWERDWDRQWGTAMLVTPKVVGLPGDANDMSNVAWRVLRRFDATELVRLVAAVAFRLEIWGHGSPFARFLVGEMNLPPGPGNRLLAEVRGGAPAFDPRCLRWIVQEVAAAVATSRWERAIDPPAPTDEVSAALLDRVLFGSCLGADREPSVAETLRAIWLLHDGFTHHTAEGMPALDAVLSITGALGYGHRPREAWMDRLNQWKSVWEIEDTHPSLLNNPAAMGQPHKPSDIRRLVRDCTGLTVADLMTGGLGVAARFFAWVASNEPHLATPGRLAESVTDRGNLHPTLLATFADHVVATVPELGHRLLDELNNAGMPYSGLGTTPTYDMRAIADRPIVELDDDGAWAPLGLPLLVDRLVELPRAIALTDGRLGDSRTLGGLVGYMFEAAVSDLMTGLRDRHHVLLERDLVAALGRREGGDGVIGYGGRYLVIEASVQTLGANVAAGSARAVRRRCTDYHQKANQAERTLGRLGDIARFHGRPSPESASFLVVTDVPLTLNPGVAAELRAQRPDRNPKFVCSLEEFERLLELGDIGWEIPAAVMNWQARPSEAPLTEQLDGMSKIVGADTRWRFDLQEWLDAIPVDVADAA